MLAKLKNEKNFKCPCYCRSILKQSRWRFKFILDKIEIEIVVIYWQYDNRYYRVYQFSEMLAQVLKKKYWEGGRASIGVIAPTNQILCKVFRGTSGNFQDTYLQTQKPVSNRWVYWGSSLNIEHQTYTCRFWELALKTFAILHEENLLVEHP